MQLISVIVPVYNVAIYLSRIITALVEQTYPNIEIIMVDDGSKDDSYKICCGYAEKYNNIRVYHKENSGAASTRNYGLKKAKGVYVTFVDADDYISKDYVEFLYKIMIENKADISVCGFKKFFGNNIEICGDEREETKVFSPEQALEDLLYRRNLTNSPCLKLFKREFVENFMFPEGMLYEDLAVVYKWFGESKTIVYSPKVKYYYFQREGSSMHSKFNARKLDKLLIMREMENYIVKKYPHLRTALDSRMFISVLQLIREVPLTKEYSSCRKELKCILRQLRYKVFKDTNNTQMTRVLAVCGYLPYVLLREMENVADWGIMHLKIVQKY